MNKGFLVFLIFLSGCSYFESHDEKSGGDLAEVVDLDRKIETVLAEVVGQSSVGSGWPSATDCDGLLWAGLSAAAGVPGVDLGLAELAPGVIGRRPAPADCYREDLDQDGQVDSRSTTSGDMALGYLWGVWRTQRLDLAQRFADACQARALAMEDVPACILGEPYPDMAERLVLRPNSMGLLGRVVYELSGGLDDRPWRNTPALYVGRDGEADYEKHLASLGIALQGEVREGRQQQPLYLMDIDGLMLERLQELVKENPADWTAQAALAVYAGTFKDAISVLLADTPCPSYTRGSDINCKVSWLFAAQLVRRRYQGN